MEPLQKSGHDAHSKNASRQSHILDSRIEIQDMQDPIEPGSTDVDERMSKSWIIPTAGIRFREIDRRNQHGTSKMPSIVPISWTVIDFATQSRSPQPPTTSLLRMRLIFLGGLIHLVILIGLSR